LNSARLQKAAEGGTLNDENGAIASWLKAREFRTGLVNGKSSAVEILRFQLRLFSEQSNYNETVLEVVRVPEKSKFSRFAPTSANGRGGAR